MQSIIPCMRYQDAPAAMRWLCKAFGFVEHMSVPNPDGTIAHAELMLESNVIMLGSARKDDLNILSPAEIGGVSTACVYVILTEVDAHHARAKAAGATIIRELANTDYGSREYTARDPEGHVWSFGTYRPAA